MTIPLLSIILFLPLVGALGAALLPRLAGWGWALGFALADLVAALAVLPQFDPNAPGFQLAEHVVWLPDAGINYALGLDGLSLFLIALNALLTAVAVGASWRIAGTNPRSREYFALMMLLAFGMQGVFLATNLFLFYLFWEVMLIPAYLLVGIFGGPRRAYAAIKFVLYTAVGSLLMLVGVIATGALASGAAHGYTLDLPALLAAGVPRDAQVWLFLAFTAAFAVKAALFPFHGWVADAYSEAPVTVTVLIAGVMAKTGTYGFLRFCLPLFPAGLSTPIGPLTLGQWIAWLAVVGILYFALQALVAQDMLRLLAYISISHMGVILLGIFTGTVQGTMGAILQMVNHGILIAALFLIAGAIEARTGTRQLADFGGLATRLPWLATVFMIVSLATLGLPGLNSFAGEFLAFLGAFHANLWWGVFATAVIVPAAWYMLRFFQGVTEGPLPERGPLAALVAVASPSRAQQSGQSGRQQARRQTGQSARRDPSSQGEAPSAIKDLRPGEALTLLPLVALILVLGVAPGLVTSRLQRADGTLALAALATRALSNGQVTVPTERQIQISAQRSQSGTQRSQSQSERDRASFRTGMSSATIAAPVSNASSVQSLLAPLLPSASSASSSASSAFITPDSSHPGVAPAPEGGRV